MPPRKKKPKKPAGARLSLERRRKGKKRQTVAGDIGRGASQAAFKFLGTSKKRQAELAKARASKAKAGGSTIAQRLKSERTRKKALNEVLAREEKPTREFAKRAIKKGQTPAKAIQQGRVLHNAGRIDEKGRLKKSGGEKLSQSKLKKLLRI